MSVDRVAELERTVERLREQVAELQSQMGSVTSALAAPFLQQQQKQHFQDSAVKTLQQLKVHAHLPIPKHVDLASSSSTPVPGSPSSSSSSSRSCPVWTVLDCPRSEMQSLTIPTTDNTIEVLLSFAKCAPNEDGAHHHHHGERFVPTIEKGLIYDVWVHQDKHPVREIFSLELRNVETKQCWKIPAVLAQPQVVFFNSKNLPTGQFSLAVQLSSDSPVVCARFEMVEKKFKKARRANSTFVSTAAVGESQELYDLYMISQHSPGGNLQVDVLDEDNIHFIHD